MTLYASKTPRDLNHDPDPMINCVTGQRVPVADPTLGWTYWPRPEFDHVQHNPVNPILVAYRAYLAEHRLDTYAGYWLFSIEAYDVFGGYREWDLPSHPFHVVAQSLFEERDHARRVLERLANLSAA